MRKYFLPYVILETLFVMMFIYKYGFFALLLEVILSIAIGFVLISKFGMLDLVRDFRTISPKDISGNFGIALGGLFLLIPGILSDTIGFLIIISSLIMKFLGKDYMDLKTSNKTDKKRYQEDDDIIDVEIIDERNK